MENGNTSIEDDHELRDAGDGEDRTAWQPGSVTLVGGYLMGLRCLAHVAVVPVSVVASKMSSTARQLGIVPSPDGKRTIFV